MAAPASVDEFLDLVRKSGVADEKRLDAYMHKMRAALPADPGQAAGLLVEAGLITNFQSENILLGKWRRFSIGKYKVLERLGSGGYAQVYLCEHKLMRRRVAVKVLPVAKTKDSSALDRFILEARCLVQLDHPNIVHAYDVDKDEDLHFIVMEYVDGANLQEIIKKSGPLDVLRACHYMRQAALALQHAHENSLIHRDIKPGNILVDRTGVVKVLDLGLARDLNRNDDEDQLTKKHDDGTLGTADYLSPEQAIDSHEVDIRTDIYSLGVTFYFLLTGRAPFEGMQLAQKLLAQQVKPPPPISGFRKDVPAEVIAIIAKMMAKDKDQRFPVPGDVADALAPFTQEQIAPPSESELPHLSPLAKGSASSAETATVARNDTPKPSASPGSGSTKEVRALKAVAAVAAAPKPEIEPWNIDTGQFTAQDDTAPHAPRSSAKSKTKLGATSRRSLFVAVLLVVLIASFATVGGVGGAIWWFTKPRANTPARGGPHKLIVSKDPKRATAYASIQRALNDAKVGSVIELWDDVDENIFIDDTNGRPTDFTIQAAAGKQIVWRAPARTRRSRSSASPRQPISSSREKVSCSTA